MATTASPPQQRRPSITQRLSSLIPGRRGSQGQSQSGAQPRVASLSKEKGKAGEGFEGGEGLRRTVSPLEQGNEHLKKYQPAAALSIYSAALKECATPEPSSPTHELADPIASGSGAGSASTSLPIPASTSNSTSTTSDLATSPGGTVYLPTPSEKLELELKHALCRLKVGHCAEALAGAQKVIAKVDAKEAVQGAAGLSADEVTWRKKAKWIEETAREGKEYAGGQIPAR